jgi:hypothetical protein
VPNLYFTEITTTRNISLLSVFFHPVKLMESG